MLNITRKKVKNGIIKIQENLMDKRCSKCGTILNETNLGRFLCPNCNIVYDDSIAEKEDKEIRERSYLG
jgi:uncharacterized Zn finger protein (UPF0148 family)